MRIDKRYRVVVGTDFGTWGTAWGWARVDPDSDEPEQIRVFANWPGGRGGLDTKAPTAVLVDVDGQIMACGFEAQHQAPAMRADRPGSGVRLIHGFKMSLLPTCYRTGGRPSDIGLADDEPHAERLIATFLRYVRELAVNHLRSQIPDLREDEIRWCVTVPAMWDDHQKQIMRGAAEGAGFPADGTQLLLAYEPDAAAHNARVSDLTYLTTATGGDRLTTETCQQRLPVVDNGGGTIDGTCYLIDADGYLIETDREGIPQGSLYVNRALQLDTLARLLGGDVELQRIETVAPYALKELLDEWEQRKRPFAIDDTRPIPLGLKYNLVKHLSPEVRDRIVADQDGNEDDLLIAADDARRAYEAVIPHILDLIDRKLAGMSGSAQADGQPAIVLLVGGFSQIPYVHQRIAQHLNGRAIVAVSTRALVDAVEGAVRFAYSPKVRSRRAQYTYGVGTCKPFRKGVDKKHKRSTSHPARNTAVTGSLSLCEVASWSRSRMRRHSYFTRLKTIRIR